MYLDEEDLNKGNFPVGPGAAPPLPPASPQPDEPIVPKPEPIDPLAEIKQQEADAQKKKAMLGVLGGVFQGISDRPSGYELYTGKTSTRPNMKGIFDAAASGIEDPLTQQQKAFAYIKAKNEATASQADAGYSAAMLKPDSKESMALKQLAPRWGIETTPEMTGAEVQRLIDPKKMMQTEAEAKVDYGKKASLFNMEQEAKTRDKKDLMKEKLGDKADADYQRYVERKEAQAATLRGDDAAKLSSAKLSAISSGRALLKQYEGREDEMTPDQLSLLAADRVKAVTGVAPSVEEMRHMMPHNAGTSWSETKGYWTGKPEPANSGGWAREAEKDFAVQEKAARDILKGRQTGITSDPRLHPEDRERIGKMAVPPEFDQTSPPPPQTKIINGITYQKVTGGWQQVTAVGQK